MVKVIGPALSLGASKSLGKILTYQKRPSGSAVYLHHQPGSREPFIPSYKQMNQRAKIACLTAQWQGMTTAQKLVWENEAEDIGELGTGYHYWLKKAQTNFKFYSGCRAYWNFNESSGATALDISGNNNHGTLKPSYPSNCPARVKGQNAKFGNAIYTIIDDYVSCPSVSFNYPITYMARFKPQSGTGSIHALGKYYNGYVLGVSSGQYYICIYINNTVKAWSVAGAKMNVWVQLCVTFDGQDIRFYFNENKVRTTNFPGNLSQTGSAWEIGRGGYAGSYFNGDIDEVKIFDRVLTDIEIAKHSMIFLH